MDTVPVLMLCEKVLQHVAEWQFGMWTVQCLEDRLHDMATDAEKKTKVVLGNYLLLWRTMITFTDLSNWNKVWHAAQCNKMKEQEEKIE